MDKNNIIGLGLIFALLFAWSIVNRQTPEQIAEMERKRDSIEQASQLDNTVQQQIEEGTLPTGTVQNQFTDLPDSLKNLELAKRYGIFGSAGAGSEETTVIENNLVKVTLTNKGGKIKEVELKEHFKLLEDSTKTDVKSVLKLMEDSKNKWEYKLPLQNGNKISTGDLYFNASQSGSAVTYQAPANNGGYFEQKYSLKPDSYEIDYDIKFQGLNNALANDASQIELNWVNYLDKLEKSTYWEKMYTSIYFKEVEEDPSYCSCTSDGEEDADNNPVEWVSSSNQFFNASLMSDGKPFSNGLMKTKMVDENAEDIKITTAQLQIPYGQTSSETFAMKMYIGPNEYERMQSFENELEQVIPFGRSVFGTVNRYVIRPMFGFISGFVSNKGIAILIMIIILKTLLYPLQYKALYSQSKMAALKPEMAKLKEKHKDDPQAAQMENMKLYREYGVSPVGSCLPIMAQLPIWIALYRFFPAAIEFRQASFLWAPDLSTYDAFFQLPFNIPFFGEHLSLFTLLWAITTVIYTYYNTKHMDMAAMQNPMMKYMQYLMPIMFMGFFNSYASGLTAYLFFSNLINISQTIITKEFIINKDKVRLELETNKNKPKKKGGFADKMQDMLKEQQKVAEQKQKQAANAKKKKRK